MQRLAALSRRDPAEVSRAICSLIFSGTLSSPGPESLLRPWRRAFPATVAGSAWPHVRPDLCAVDNTDGPRKYFDRMYFDSLVHDPEVVRYLIDLAGPGHVMLGSDYPFPLGEARPGELIESLSLDGPTTEQLLFGSACRWLGVSPEHFVRDFLCLGRHQTAW